MKRSITNDFFAGHNQSLCWCLFIVLAFGTVMVASASFVSEHNALGDTFSHARRHVMHIALSLVIATFIALVPASKIIKRGGLLAFLSIVLLILVFIPEIGKQVNNSRRWLNLGGFSVQPSEFVKLFLIIFMANYIGHHHDSMANKAMAFIKPLTLTSLIAALIIGQPDFGTAVVVIAIASGMLFLAPVRKTHFLLLSVVFVVVLSAILMLEGYRVERVLAFMDPWQDRYDSGYQLIESLTAVANGGWFGIGLGDGIQKLSYIPEAHNDFILAVVAEELGFVGLLFVCALFCFLVRSCFSIAHYSHAQGFVAYAFYAYGVAIWIAVQFLFNTAVTLGALPTKGITLPFISVGGSSLMALLCAMALLMRIHYEVSSTAQQPQFARGYGY